MMTARVITTIYDGSADPGIDGVGGGPDITEWTGLCSRSGAPAPYACRAGLLRRCHMRIGCRPVYGHSTGCCGLAVNAARPLPPHCSLSCLCAATAHLHTQWCHRCGRLLLC